MKLPTLSMAKNVMRRSLSALLDPPASAADQARLRLHFDGCCAYCAIRPAPRSAHLDHARSGGGNGVGNLLYACSLCNGDEKRERDWEDFLREKCGANDVIFAERRARIVAWFEANPVRTPLRTPEIDEALAEAERAIEAFERAYRRLREATRDARTVNTNVARTGVAR